MMVVPTMPSARLSAAAIEALTASSVVEVSFIGECASCITQREVSVEQLLEGFVVAEPLAVGGVPLAHVFERLLRDLVGLVLIVLGIGHVLAKLAEAQPHKTVTIAQPRAVA